MTELEFKSLAAQGYNRIPLIAEAFADLETPLTLYLKLAQTQNAGKNTFLLESVVGGERFGRYSFIGLPATTKLRSFGNKIEVLKDDKVIESLEGNALEFIAEFQSRYKVAIRPGMPRFCGGLAGYFGYDAVRYIEKRLADSAPKDDLGLPDIQLLVTEELAVIDNLSGKLYLIVYTDPSQPEAFSKGRQRLKDLRAMLRRGADAPVTSGSVRTETIREFPKDEYLKAVAKAKEYVMAGDLMQVQIGQRLRKSYVDSPLMLYRALRSLNPSPYMYFYNFGDMQIVGASPEILVRNETIGQTSDGQAQKKITIRPLAGTLSGAPKVRAMEIIDELEPTKRGIYGGACGYLSFGGEMDVAIAIRTGVIKDGTLYVQAAAGIVADSVPETEWEETENKARAVLRAAEQVQDGLDGEI